MIKKKIFLHNLCFLYLTICIICGNISYAYEDYVHAQNLYFKGMDYIDNRNYSEAIFVLNKSYNISEHSYTAYALSYSFGMIGDYRNARFYAKEALKGNPPLSSDVARYIDDVLNNNDNVLAGYLLDGSYDGFVASRPNRFNDPCIYTNRVTDELNGQECPTGYAIKGITCRGSNCDDKYLKCCPANYDFRYNETYMTYWFSEEPPSGFNNDQSVISGLWCKGRYCDNLMLKVIPINNVATHCYWTGFFSEEGWNFRECNENYFVSGIACSGGYCDNINLRCCKR